MKEFDKRTLKTNKLLRKSLAELLYVKKIDKISIRELTDNVDLSRNAFYSHYEDIYDLYSQMEHELFVDITSILSDVTENNYENKLSSLIDYIQSNSTIMRTFLCSTENTHFRLKLVSYFEELFTLMCLESMGTEHLEEKWKYLINYHSNGVISTFTLWINTNFYFPKEQLLKMIMDIDMASDSLYY